MRWQFMAIEPVLMLSIAALGLSTTAAAHAATSNLEAAKSQIENANALFLWEQELKESSVTHFQESLNASVAAFEMTLARKTSAAGLANFRTSPLGSSMLECSQAQDRLSQGLALMKTIQSILVNSNLSSEKTAVELQTAAQLYQQLSLSELEVVDRTLEQEWAVGELIEKNPMGMHSLESFSISKYFWKGIWHDLERDGVSFDFTSSHLKIRITASALTACFGSEDFYLSGKAFVKSSRKEVCESTNRFEEEDRSDCQPGEQVTRESTHWKTFNTMPCDDHFLCFLP